MTLWHRLFRFFIAAGLRLYCDGDELSAMNDGDLVAFWYAYRGTVLTLVVTSIHPIRREGLDESEISNAIERTLFTDSSICCICLAQHDTRGSVTLGCCHCFHRVCISQWLERSSTCPVCRASVRQ